MYSDDNKESFEMERILEIVTSDCKFHDPSIYLENTIEDKIKWCFKRADEVVPKHLEIINKTCEANMKKNGFASTNKLSIADVVVLTYLQSLLNPFLD